MTNLTLSANRAGLAQTKIDGYASLIFDTLPNAPGLCAWVGEAGSGKTTAARIQQAAEAERVQNSSRFLPCDLIAMKRGVIDERTVQQALAFLALFSQTEVAESTEIFEELAKLIESNRDQVVKAVNSFRVSGVYGNDLRLLGTLEEKGNSAVDAVLSAMRRAADGSVKFSALLQNKAYAALICSLTFDEWAREIASNESDGSASVIMYRISKFAIAMRKVVGPAASFANERTIEDDGLTVSVVRADRADYVIDTGVAKYSIVGESPIQIVLALSFAFVTRVGTVNPSFGKDIEFGSLLSGGLDEKITISIQTLNDVNAATGGIVIAELRDDYAKNQNHDTPFPGFSDAVAPTVMRLLASSRCGIYLRDKGEGILRVRAYAKHELDFIEYDMKFDLRDLSAKSYFDVDTYQAVFENGHERKDAWSELVKAVGGQHVAGS